MASLTWEYCPRRQRTICTNHHGEEVTMPATLDRDVLPEGVTCADPEGWEDTRPADAPSRNFDVVTDPDGHVIEDPPEAVDVVKNPSHYAQHKIQPIEFVLANNLSYCQGAVIKYLLRYNLKDGVRDLEKAREFINIMIADYKEKNPS